MHVPLTLSIQINTRDRTTTLTTINRAPTYLTIGVDTSAGTKVVAHLSVAIETELATCTPAINLSPGLSAQLAFDSLTGSTLTAALTAPTKCVVD